MNRIKIGFLAVVAVVAMSFTIADKSGAFNKKSPVLRAADCYSTLVKVQNTIFNKGSLIACPSGLIGQNLRQPVLGDPTTGPASLIDPTISCPGQPTYFCCARIETSLTSPEEVTPVSLTQGKYKVKEVFCYTN